MVSIPGSADSAMTHSQGPVLQQPAAYELRRRKVSEMVRHSLGKSWLLKGTYAAGSGSRPMHPVSGAYEGEGWRARGARGDEYEGQGW